MAVKTVMPSPFQVVEDPASGELVPGALIATYAAGSSTPIDTYTDSTGVSLNTNPIVAGDPSAQFSAFLTPGVAYKFVYQTPEGVLLRTYDYIYGNQLTTDDMGFNIIQIEALIG